MELESLLVGLGSLALFGAGFGAGFFVRLYTGKKQNGLETEHEELYELNDTEIFCARYCLQTEHEKLYELVNVTRELMSGDLDSAEMEENMRVNVSVSLGYRDMDEEWPETAESWENI